MQKESIWQVLSLVVQVKAEQFQAVQQQILSLDNAEIPVVEEASGKMVVLLSGNDKDLFSTMENLKNITGVMAVSLAFHQQEA